jgi:hypothetical protein
MTNVVRLDPRECALFAVMQPPAGTAEDPGADMLRARAANWLLKLELTFKAVAAADSACYRPATRTVEGPYIVNETSFAVVLHEIGHAVVRGSTHAEEASAWRWAIEHSHGWTAAMQACLWRSITSYVPSGSLPEDLPKITHVICLGGDSIVDDKRQWTPALVAERLRDLRAAWGTR